MLTRCLAKALAPYIRVNSVAPGAILSAGEALDTGMRKAIHSTPLKQAGSPKDIAEMVLFLASQGDYITGQIFPVDGGKSIP